MELLRKWFRVSYDYFEDLVFGIIKQIRLRMPDVIFVGCFLYMSKRSNNRFIVFVQYINIKKF